MGVVAVTSAAVVVPSVGAPAKLARAVFADAAAAVAMFAAVVAAVAATVAALVSASVGAAGAGSPQSAASCALLKLSEPVKRLLVQYDTFAPSLQVIRQYLEQVGRALQALPVSPGRTGLQQLLEFLAQQTETLAV